ncbi:MAG: hypothetical protein H7X70_06660 [Candidatus Kapabacteria bacterium]|nr:hypothetical protein [Candidatus Kapabacteria bacterium]
MKFSSILKGLILTVALFTFVSEAAAQLPVRTRSLQLLGITSGTLTQNTPTVTVDYTVTWPAAGVAVIAGHKSFLYATALSTATQQNLAWFDVNGDIVDNNAGTGLAGQVTYWADDNSITGEAGFLWSALNNTLTIGEAASPAEIVYVSGAFTGTLQTAALTANTVYNLPAVPAAPVFIPVATGVPSVAVDDQILLSNIDGTATWSANPFAGVERGTADPADGAFTHTQATVGAIDAFGIAFNDLIMVSSIDVNASPTGNILSVTAVAANSFTISSSGPFGATERISWLFIPIP